MRSRSLTHSDRLWVAWRRSRRSTVTVWSASDGFGWCDDEFAVRLEPAMAAWLGAGRDLDHGSVIAGLDDDGVTRLATVSFGVEAEVVDGLPRRLVGPPLVLQRRRFRTPRSGLRPRTQRGQRATCNARTRHATPTGLVGRRAGRSVRDGQTVAVSAVATSRLVLAAWSASSALSGETEQGEAGTDPSLAVAGCCCELAGRHGPATEIDGERLGFVTGGEHSLHCCGNGERAARRLGSRRLVSIERSLTGPRSETWSTRPGRCRCLDQFASPHASPWQLDVALTVSPSSCTAAPPPERAGGPVGFDASRKTATSKPTPKPFVVILATTGSWNI